jgi:hypothetical protein
VSAAVAIVLLLALADSRDELHHYADPNLVGRLVDLADLVEVVVRSSGGRARLELHAVSAEAGRRYALQVSDVKNSVPIIRT